jgi:hypothetical protein
MTALKTPDSIFAGEYFSFVLLSFERWGTKMMLDKVNKNKITQ